MFGKYFLLCATLVVASTNAEYDVNTYCTLVKNGAKLASIESCQTYYLCQNGIGIRQTCANNESFDKYSQTCRPSYLVQCYYGNARPCANKPDGFVPQVGTCGGYIVCKQGAESGRGFCPLNLVFSNGKCIYGKCNPTNPNDVESKGMVSICEVMPNGLYFGSTLDCKTWQMCNNNQLKTGVCADEFVFNAQAVRCDYDDGNTCARVTGENIQPEDNKPQPCSTVDEGKFKGDLTKCSVYYQCLNKLWVRSKCSYGFYYDVKQNKCLTREMATPIATCDRCEGTTKQFVNAIDSKCIKYSVCKKGIRKSTGICPGVNSYFDETAQACINDDGVNRLNYAQANGACAATATTGNTGTNAGSGTGTDTGSGSGKAPDGAGTNAGTGSGTENADGGKDNNGDKKPVDGNGNTGNTNASKPEVEKPSK